MIRAAGAALGCAGWRMDGGEKSTISQLHKPDTQAGFAPSVFPL
ncbi:hypothetical protein CGMCC3_g3113 [Colletotrichum fructicola]|nr:uncharacterized protein CGMCC3_g3113 [Colletotrichum fructicola]KAE9580929.1 hypothetical protein CGMCC3_g3113 [Colletotrichum fructicola]